MTAQKNEITIETRERRIIHRPQQAAKGWRSFCDARVDLLTGVLICLPSLLAERSGDTAAGFTWQPGT